MLERPDVVHRRTFAVFKLEHEPPIRQPPWQTFTRPGQSFFFDPFCRWATFSLARSLSRFGPVASCHRIGDDSHGDLLGGRVVRSAPARDRSCEIVHARAPTEPGRRTSERCGGAQAELAVEPEPYPRQRRGMHEDVRAALDVCRSAWGSESCSGPTRVRCSCGPTAGWSAGSCWTRGRPSARSTSGLCSCSFATRGRGAEIRRSARAGGHARSRAVAAGHRR
jgi:hypothetical protein